MASPAKTGILKKFFERGEAAQKSGSLSAFDASDFENLAADQQIAKLKADVERYRSQLKLVDSILNYAPFPIWVRDDTLSIKYCNNSYCETVDMTHEMLLGEEFVELGKGVRSLAEKASEAGEQATGNIHIITAGERRLYKVTELPLISSGQMIGYAFDITEQEKAEEEIKLHISAQADLLETSNSAMAIYGPDTRLKFYNHAFVNLWDVPEQWLDNSPTYGEILERLRESRKIPEQANFQLFKKEHLKLFTDLIKTHEEFIYPPDGKVLRMIVIPHTLGGLLFAYEDVTDRLALERSYNTLIAVQKATLDNLFEAVAVYGEDGRLKLYNPNFMKLWGLDDSFLSTHPHISDIMEKVRQLYLYSGTWAEYKEKRISSVLRRESNKLTMQRSDGKYLSTSYVPLPDGATLVTFVDVTDTTMLELSLREKNQALEEADRLKSEFLANVSYELRSPLTSIKGFTEILGSGMLGEASAKHKEYIEYIDQASGVLMELINDILDVATIEAGFLKLEKTNFQLYEVISHLVFLVHARAEKNNLALHIDCPGDIGEIYADETRIKQVILNLLSNSLKFTPHGGFIKVGARVVEVNGKEFAEIWVQDTGVGISEKEQGVVFDKFYKAGSTTAHKSGTGLGLTLAKNIVHMHGGEISIESEPGKGTKVSFTIPRNEQ